MYLSVYPVVVYVSRSAQPLHGDLFQCLHLQKSNVSGAAVIGVFEISTYKYADSFSSSKWI